MSKPCVDIPELIKTNRTAADCLHVFFVANPVTATMVAMIVDEYDLPRDRVRVVSIRHSDASASGFPAQPLQSARPDRYINRLTGRHMGAIRLKRQLRGLGSKYIIYASWHYAEIEEVTSSPACLGTVIFEEGQLTYYNLRTYQKAFRNTWRFRRPRIAAGLIDNFIRSDTAAFIGLSPMSFPGIGQEKRFILDNFSAAMRNYKIKLGKVRSIGLMPAPSRLSPSDVFPAIAKLAGEIPNIGVVKLHPGYRSQPYYSQEKFADYVREVSNGRVRLCPEDVVVELEMVVEKKVLYGTRTSLSRYAKMLGSEFREIVFDNYMGPTV